MGDLTSLFKLDFPTVIIGVFIILSACIAVYEIIGKFSKIIGKPVKWVRDKEKDHELLIQTSKELKDLEEHHKKDVSESIKHDEKIEKNLEVLTSMVLDKAIDDYRYEILDFCSALSNGRKYNRESFNHIFSVYEKYEKILKENKMENGLVEESIKFIREKYSEKLKMVKLIRK